MSRRGTRARKNLAAQQEQLLFALLAGDGQPPGFQPDRLRAQTDALLAKRLRVVRKLRPELDALGDRLPELFDAFARHTPRRTGTSARADAGHFAEWLQARGFLRRPKFWWWRRAVQRLTN